MNKQQVFFRSRFCLSAVCLLLGSAPLFAERFGDISVTPQTVISGETHHGYRELRVIVENQSFKNAHKVTLVYPDHSYGSGNTISRLSRSITIAPGTRAVTPLWLPALPVNGDGSLRVEVDNDNVGTVRAQDATRHFVRNGYPYYGGSGGPVTPATVLVSRGLNFDELDKSFNSKPGAGDYSAAMATGAPDSARRRGSVPTAWMPDPSSTGPNWLELDYANPQVATKVRVYSTMNSSTLSEVVLISASGTNRIQVAVPTTSRSTFQDVSFPATSEPIKTVRLNFKGSGPRPIVDAVELSGPSGSAWAATARASSEATAAFAAPSPGGTPSKLCDLVRCELPMSEWSEAWISYTPYDAIALSSFDLQALPAAAFSAVRSYVECGGNLIVFGAVPEAWHSFPKASADIGERFDIGLGQCFAIDANNLSTFNEEQIKTLTSAAEHTAKRWQSLPTEEGANQAFAVIENYKVPVRSTIFVMLVFVIAIGPTNMIVLSRMKRRTWLLWTIPAISLFTCIVVFAYSFVREGVTPTVRIDGLTLLDQASRRAATVGMTAFYCPLTPSQGLAFSPDTEAVPLVETWNWRGGTDRQMDWTQSQHLGRGWVTARIPAHFALRKAEVRRERLQIESTPDQLTAVNGLGAVIKSLWLADDSGKLFTATNVAAGQKAVLLTQANGSKVAGKAALHNLFEAGNLNLSDELLKDPPNSLSPGTYIAELDSNPFLENGLGSKAGATRTKSHAVVYGILESTTQP